MRIFFLFFIFVNVLLFLIIDSWPNLIMGIVIGAILIFDIVLGYGRME